MVPHFEVCLQNFYRFQMREEKRETLQSLRDQFEKDKDELRGQLKSMTSARDEAISERSTLTSELAELGGGDGSALAAERVAHQSELERA